MLFLIIIPGQSTSLSFESGMKITCNRVHRAIEGSEVRSPVLNACSLISPRGEVNWREKSVPNT